MKGADHYLEAERWASYAADIYQNDREHITDGQVAAAIAQVHATLAVAAATAVPHQVMAVDDFGAWVDALNGGAS